MAAKPRFDGEWAKLGEVCTVISGSTPKSKNPEYWNGKIKWVTPAELSDSAHYIEDTVKHITEDGFSSASLRMLPIGTVLLTSRAPIGKVAITRAEMCCNQGFKNLVCSDALSNEFLFRTLKYHSATLQAMGRGATFKELSKKDVESFKIKLPSKEVQTNIVMELESIERPMAIMKQQLEKLDILIKSRFVEMFGSDDCIQTTMGRLVSGIVAGTNVGGQQRPIGEGEYAVLKISAVTKGIFDSSQYKVVEDVSSIKMIHPKKGDLLFSRANTSEMVGATALVDRDYDRLFLPDKLWRIEPAEGVNAIFLKALLSSSQVRAEMSKVSTGSSGSMQNISMAKFRNLPAILPPLPLQQEFADFVARVDKSRFVVQQQIEKLQMLYDSLAQEYFS